MRLINWFLGWEKLRMEEINKLVFRLGEVKDGRD